MKIEVGEGFVKWVITSTDGLKEEDFVSVISNANLSTSKFIEIYYDYTTTLSHVDAYEKVELLHTNLFGKPRFSSYESFRVIKSKFMNK